MSRPPHKITSGQIIIRVSSHRFETQGTKTQAGSSFYTEHNQLQTSQTKTVNNELFQQSNNLWKQAFFCPNKRVATGQGNRNLEFRIKHLLEPAPQIQTATAHLQTT